ncbi:MAG TPA: hypothetical protein VGK10_12020 [Prolixibacteraceae bacterium]|jgi:hypothetical protein
MKISKLIFFSLLLCLHGQVFSQTETSTEPTSFIKTIGVGIHLEQFKIHDMGGYSDNIPSNKIVLTINPSRSFRLEPEFGFNSNKRTTSNVVRKDNYWNMGLGTFGMTQFNRLNVYFGARFEYDIQTSKQNYAATEDNSKVNFFTIGPAIGCEYFLVNQITLGGEIGVKYGTKSPDDKDSQLSDNEDETSLWTDTGLFLRFYF